MRRVDPAALGKGVLAGDRRSLAKAITLLESTLPADRDAADQLLVQLLAEPRTAVRIGVSGSPGVGKSTFIESFGQTLLAQGHRLAILAIDPSSPVSGGSILGDRTRMEQLSRDERVFIRPSPAGKTLGGVARHTREAIVPCEKAGYDVVLVETVGVGQSEFVAASMVDVFLMLHLPNSGDDLQGIKRGILELADVVAITKADGDGVQAAHRAKNQLEHALMLARTPGHWLPPVLLTSGLKGEGMDAVKTAIFDFVAAQRASGAFDRRRKEQARQWFHDELGEQLRDALRTDARLAKETAALEQRVVAGELTGNAAARSLIAALLTSRA